MIAWRYSQGAVSVGIDEFGAYWQDAHHWQRLQFVRINDVQLIATIAAEERRLKSVIWPTYRVIYRDSVPYDAYRLLRSYAAKQMMLKRGEEARRRFTRL